MKIVAIRDRAVNAFLQPFFVRSAGEAVRIFADEINRKESPMYAHPEDYDLYDIGLYDADNGEIVGTKPSMLSIGKDEHKGE